MTRIEYDCLCGRRPDLKLPDWILLFDPERRQVEGCTEEELVAAITSATLNGTYVPYDFWMGSRNCFPLPDKKPLTKMG